ncbi:MAG: chemotaxis protein CheR, partial [Acidobacteriota bacterium]
MAPTQRLSPQLQQTFARLIANRLGLTLRKSDQAELQVFIFNRLGIMGLDAPEKYYLLLNENTARSHQEWLQLISVVTNTESFFFRDKGQFSLLKNYLLPTLIEKKSDKKRLRICSA